MFDLPEYKVVSRKSEGRDTSLEVEIIGEPLNCETCDEVMSPHGKKPLGVRDVNIGYQRVEATILRIRFRCGKCGSMKTPKPPLIHPGHRMTKRLVDYIENEATRRPDSTVARELGLEVKTVRNIFNESFDERIGKLGIVTPSRMGIDEVRLGNKTHAVIVNLETKTLVEILPDRSYETVSRYLSALPDGDKVTMVAMDNWEPYRRAVKNTLGCPVVLDRFHAVMMAQRSMERARKHYRNIDQKNAPHMKACRKLLLTRRERLSPQEQADLDKMLGRFPILGECHRALEEFRKIWEAGTRPEGEARLSEWLTDLQREAKRFFGDTRDTVIDWREEILSYFDFGDLDGLGDLDEKKDSPNAKGNRSNAVTESMNRKIRDMFRAGNGYSVESLRRKALLRYGSPN